MLAESIPRYKEPSWDELREPVCTCSNCIYYKEFQTYVSGYAERCGACCFDVFQADTLKELSLADLEYKEPDDEACDDYKE